MWLKCFVEQKRLSKIVQVLVLKNAIKYKAVLNQNMKFYLEISSKNLQLCPTANKTLLREITVNW